MATDIGGVWRTVGGRRIFIKDGEDLETAMKKSGKFGKDKIKSEEQLEEEDRKIYTNGEYDVKSYMGQILGIEKFSINQEYQETIGGIPQQPKNESQAEKGLEWYDKSYKASIKAKEDYEKELNKFKSQKIQELINQKINFYKDNAENAKKDKEWYKRAYSKYFK